MHGISKKVVEATLQALNDKIERLGWARRYEVQFGSNPNGIKHVIQTRLPHLQHPVDPRPFNTLSKVRQHLLAMDQVANDALLERARERVTVMAAGHSRPVASYDPDARSATRSKEF